MPSETASAQGNVKIEKQGDKIIITVPEKKILEGVKVADGKVLDFCNCSSVLGAVASFI